MAIGRKKIYLIAFIFLFLLDIGINRVFAATTGSGQINIKATVLGNIENIIQTIMPGQFVPLEFGVPPMNINNGQAKTNSLQVQIEFQVKGASLMQIGNRGDLNGAVWEPYSGHKTWEMTPGDGQKTIYARFKTLSGFPSKIISGSIILDTTAPANVGEFYAAAGNGLISLTWKNPSDPDFTKVRIVRKADFYPANPQDGLTVYDGAGESFNDAGLANGTAYYYTAFAYDDLGNYASGAVAGATPGKPGVIPEIPVVEAPPQIEGIDLPQFDFIQNGGKLTPVDGQVTVGRFQPFTVSIPYGAVPEVLKTIMVTLKQGDKMFSFLLKANADSSAYEATVVPPDTGVYPLTITILDYKNQAFKKITGELNVIKAQIAPDQTVQYIITKKAPPILYILFVLLALLAAEEIYRAARKYRRQAQSHKLKVQTKF